jgi:hypothetical protein
MRDLPGSFNGDEEMKIHFLRPEVKIVKRKIVKLDTYINMCGQPVSYPGTKNEMEVTCKMCLKMIAHRARYKPIFDWAIVEYGSIENALDAVMR